MRIRKAAIAGVTALAVAFGGTAVASAAEGSSNASTTATATPTPSPDKDTNKKPGGSSALGQALEADKEANAQNIFGQHSSISKEPKWAQALAGIGIASTIITILGGLVGPALNFFKYGLK
ncbi:hypothetical protein [Corynebacterium sp.]|uniref:hypothetical protein n=1 Tax=Corynebacterium sp. TaxID=1720 RepID=UPI0026DB70A0|nr:hypothetical protein [Corynebacterium sp.]MDO5032483.1 hypothetical protein [Corynebacterium sp.]